VLLLIHLSLRQHANTRLLLLRTSFITDEEAFVVVVVAGKLSHPLSYSLSDLSRRRERTHQSRKKEESSFSSKKTKTKTKDEREYYDSIIKR